MPESLQLRCSGKFVESHNWQKIHYRYKYITSLCMVARTDTAWAELCYCSDSVKVHIGNRISIQKLWIPALKCPSLWSWKQRTSTWPHAMRSIMLSAWVDSKRGPKYIFRPFLWLIYIYNTLKSILDELESYRGQKSRDTEIWTKQTADSWNLQ